MSKKTKLSQEETKAEIERQVIEAQKVWREERMYNAEKRFMEKAFDALAYEYKYEYLSSRYMLSVGKFMIDNSRLSEEDKDLMRSHFADVIIWTGSSGITEDQWPALEEASKAIIEKLREPI